MGNSISILENFVSKQSNLSEYINKIIEISNSLNLDSESLLLTEYNKRLLSNIFKIIVIGEFKRGKSTFINAILGDKILPVGITPTTATVNIVKYSDNPSAKVFYKDETDEEISIEDLKTYVTTKGENIENINYVLINYPSKVCKEGVEIVDSPGVNDIDEQRVEITYDYIPKCDAAIFLMNATQQLSASERDFLTNKVNKHIDKIFFILNKMDQLELKDKDEALKYVKTELINITDNKVKLFPISSKLALKAKLENNDDLLKESQIENFEIDLYKFLTEEKGNIALLVALNKSFSSIENIKNSIKLKVKSYKSDIQDLETKLEYANEEFFDLEEDKNAISKLIDDKKTQLVKLISSDVHIYIEEIKEKTSKFIISNDKSDLKEIEKEVSKFIENSLQDWSEEKELFVNAEINKLIINIENRTIDIQKRLNKIQLNFVGSKQIIEDGEFSQTLENKGIISNFIPGLIGQKMDEASDVIRGAAFIFGAALLTGGSLIPAIVLGSLASFFTGSIFKNITERKQKQELIQKYNEVMDSLPEKISPDFVENINDIFDNFLKKQIISEIEVLINNTKNTLDEIVNTKTNKQEEIDLLIKNLNDKEKELINIENNLKEIQNGIK